LKMLIIKDEHKIFMFATITSVPKTNSPAISMFPFLPFMSLIFELSVSKAKIVIRALYHKAKVHQRQKTYLLKYLFSIPIL